MRRDCKAYEHRIQDLRGVSGAQRRRISTYQLHYQQLYHILVICRGAATLRRTGRVWVARGWTAAGGMVRACAAGVYPRRVPATPLLAQEERTREARQKPREP